MGSAHVLSEPGQVKLVSHLLSWTRQRWLTEGGSGSQLGKGSSQMKKVHGPRSEPRLVGLQVVEVGELSGEGRSLLTQEKWFAYRAMDHYYCQCSNIPELCNLSDSAFFLFVF